MKCPSCKKDMPIEGIKFCCFCGSPLESTTTTPAAKKPEEETPGGALGLASEHEQARVEEERMAKMFGRRPQQQTSSSSSSLQGQHPTSSSSSSPSTTVLKAKMPEAIAASEILAELNAARTDPSGFSRKLKDSTPKYKGKSYRAEDSAGGAAMRDTEEGVNGLQDAINWIASKEPCKPLTLSLALSKSSRDIATDQALSGATGSAMSDGSDLSKRVSKYGTWRGKVGESLVYGALSAFDAIYQFSVDDGVPARSNRTKLFDPAFTIAGIHCGPHKLYGNVVSVIYVVEFAEGAAFEPRNSSSEPTANPTTNSNPAPTVTPPQKISESSEKACYTADLGPANGATPENASMCKKGAFVVLKTRKDGEHTEQRWRLPFVASASAISVKINNNGRIVMSIAKEPVGDENKRNGIVVLENHHIEATENAGSASRPEVKLGPKTTDKITASVEPAAVETSLTVKLCQEEAARSILVFDFEFLEKGSDATGTFTKTVKSGQSVKLPFVVNRESITIESKSSTLVRIVVAAPVATPYNPDAKEEPVPLT